MRNHTITYLTLCLALLAGCNKVAFIDDTYVPAYGKVPTSEDYTG